MESTPRRNEPTPIMNRLAPIAAGAAAAWAAAGCAALGSSDAYKYEQPLIAVIAFDNRAHSPYDSGLGAGISELLTNALARTGQFRVLDREDLESVLEELRLQATGRTRAEERVAPDRLKNAHYLVKGVVTEFSHVAESGLDLGVGPLRIGGGGTYAVVTLALKVIEVESGEVVYTQVVEGKVYAGGTDFDATYKNAAFGGHQFFQTPLGRALREALDQTVTELREQIGRRRWRPVIAEVDGERIYLSGGEDRRLAVGQRWAVRRLGKPIVDPRTGDLLGREPGEEIGAVRVVRVEERYAVAAAEAGAGFAKGQILAPLEGGDD